MAKKKEYISFADRFDGGGPGQSGDQFEGGGIISAIGNALGGPKIFGNTFVSGDDAPGGGIRVKHENPVPFFVDAVDGGGFGYSGNYFGDGPFSILANLYGIKPVGSENLVAPQPEIFPTPTTTNPGNAEPNLEPYPVEPLDFVPTFTDFVKLPGVSALSDEAKLKMYDALYPFGPDPYNLMQPGLRI